jgi:hypothetical protein
MRNIGSSDCYQRHACSEKHLCTEESFCLANEITRQILDQASGDFGKLVLLSSLASDHAGWYHHAGFGKAVPACLASWVLRCTHEQVFLRWLDSPLEEQWTAVREHLAARHRQNTGTPRERQAASVEALIPGVARQPERELFLSDLELVLSLLEE